MNEQSQPTKQYEPAYLDELSGPQLVGVYNQLVVEKSRIKKFETVGKGRARVTQALSDAGLNGNNLVRSNGLGNVIVLTNQEVATHDPLRVPPPLKKKPLTDAEITERRTAEAKTKRAKAPEQKRADKRTHAKARNFSHKKRNGETNTDLVMRLITRPEGATAAELCKRTGWKHATGGVSIACKKHHLTLRAGRREDGEWHYKAAK